MLAFMLDMYARRTANAALVLGAGVLLLGGLWLVRSQATVGDGDSGRARTANSPTPRTVAMSASAAPALTCAA
jgi:hypothetical protein